MSRTWPLVGLLALSCTTSVDDGSAPSRGVSVAAPEVTDQQVEAFCDSRWSADQGRPFAWPELDQAPPTRGPGWTWVSLWATWCAPCVAEMPMLAEWTSKLDGEGRRIDLHYVSVDASTADLARWRAQHEDAPEILHMRDPERVQPWLQGMGVEGVGSIPIHLWVDPQDRIRCVRSGGIGGTDLGIVRKLLEGGRAPGQAG
jgi:thiol-disulfide isomerase/thioredoxin